MKNLRKIIIILVILILVIIISIIVINNINTNKKDEKINETENSTDGIKEITSVKDETKFYTVRNCINTYLNIINTNNSLYYGYNEKGEYTKIINSKEINQHIYNLLSKEFIEKNNIELSNLNEKIEFLDKKVLFMPLDMNVLADTNVEKYVVYGILEDINSNYIKDINIIVNLDIKNNTFSIEPIKNVNKDINKIDIDNTNNLINVNSDNKFEWADVDDEYMAKEYFNSYKRMAIGNPELAYQYLDNEYKQKRFSTLNEYKKYLEEDIDKLKGVSITKYLVTRHEDYTEYVCLDQYENYYIFQVKSVMDYTLKLDTYTIESDKFKTEYNNGSDQKKVQLNIDKFIKMINNKDYSNAYAVLDEGFKNNYFKTEEDFKKYIKNNFFEYSSVTYDKFSQEGEIYIYHITVIDKIGKINNRKTMNMIMQLNGGTSFSISYNIEK